MKLIIIIIILGMFLVVPAPALFSGEIIIVKIIL